MVVVMNSVEVWMLLCSVMVLARRVADEDGTTGTGIGADIVMRSVVEFSGLLFRLVLGISEGWVSRECSRLRWSP